MQSQRIALLVFGVAATVAISSIGDDKVPNPTQDKQKIVGTWQVTSLVVNGNKSPQQDTAKLIVINGKDGTWSLRSEGNEVGKGTSRLNAASKPKAIDFTVNGAQGKLFLGVYELGGAKRKLCFAPPGKPRPTDFSSTAENQQILVTFARLKTTKRQTP